MLLTCGAIGKHGGVEAVNDAWNEKFTRLRIDFLLLTFNTTRPITHCSASEKYAFLDCINPLKGRGVNWLHFAIQA